MKIRILSVSVGRPRPLGVQDGQPVLSGIAKQIVTSDRIFVGSTNLAGDEQADLRVHGGPDKAVYAYSSVHWPWWENDHSLPCSPGTFGENLTLTDVDETQVRIGDRFSWGSAELEVSQPRAPCFKFGLHTGRADAPQLMILSARCGWYFRVSVEGEAPTNGAVLERVYSSVGPSVRDCFVAALRPGIAPEERLRASAAPGLAAAWQAALSRRLR